MVRRPNAFKRPLSNLMTLEPNRVPVCRSGPVLPSFALRPRHRRRPCRPDQLGSATRHSPRSRPPELAPPLGRRPETNPQQVSRSPGSWVARILAYYVENKQHRQGVVHAPAPSVDPALRCRYASIMGCQSRAPTQVGSLPCVEEDESMTVPAHEEEPEITVRRPWLCQNCSGDRWNASC